MVTRGIEAAGAAVVAAVLGGMVGAPLGIGWQLAAVVAANGAISGWRQIYNWRTQRGVVAFLLDSTWAAVPIAGSLVVHAGSWLTGNPGFVGDLSVRCNRHVYASGFTLRRGFAYSVGNVVTGAAHPDAPTTISPARRSLVERHEDLHVWQARAFGPTFPALYGGWMVLGAAVGSVLWLVRRPDRWARCVETCAYYNNPFEYAAYRADDYWPPSGAVASLAWRVRRDRRS